MAIWLSAIISAALLIVDQLSKFWASANLMNQDPWVLIPGVFELHYTENRGVAFSMLQGQRWIFIPITIIMTAVLFLMLLRSPMRKDKPFSLACSMVIAGAIGNLIDRIVYGFVIDFLYFSLIDFPIFNFADCCVVVGAILLFLYFLFGVKEYEDLPMLTLFFGIAKRKKESNNDG